MSKKDALSASDIVDLTGSGVQNALNGAGLMGSRASDTSEAVGKSSGMRVSSHSRRDPLRIKVTQNTTVSGFTVGIPHEKDINNLMALLCLPVTAL